MYELGAMDEFHQRFRWRTKFANSEARPLARTDALAESDAVDVATLILALRDRKSHPGLVSCQVTTYAVLKTYYQ